MQVVKNYCDICNCEMPGNYNIHNFKTRNVLDQLFCFVDHVVDVKVSIHGNANICRTCACKALVKISKSKMKEENSDEQSILYL